MSEKTVTNEPRHHAVRQHHHPKAPAAALQQAQVVNPGTGDVVTLPAGTTIVSVEAEGRDLLIVLNDGERLLVPGGAIVVPQIVVDGTVVPPTNVAALLIDSDVQPAAGPTPSSGGNFATGEGAIQAAYDLGNLLPYTELQFGTQPRQEIIPGVVDREPVVVVETPDNPVGVINAIATVYEAGLPTRNGEPAGTGEAADGNGTNNSDTRETTSGTIVFDAPDGVKEVLINDVAVDHVGQTFTSPNGTMTIASIDLANGAIGFTYTLADNMLGQTADGFFQMTVVDSDGDRATASLTINVVDDVPIANDDTDTVAAGNFQAETGNVITGVGTTSGAAGADRVGADNSSVSSVSHGGTTVNASAGTMVIAGDYGTLTLHADGSYSYARNDSSPGSVNDQFTYTLKDGDGSTDTATLTIHIQDSPVTIISVPETGDGTIVYEHGLPPRGGESVGSVEGSDGNPSNNSDPSEGTNGTITFSAPDGVATVQLNGTIITGVGQSIVVPEGTLTVTAFNPGGGTLTYNFTLSDNTSGDNTSVTFTVKVTDIDGDSDSAPFTIHIVDDVPSAADDTASVGAGEYGPVSGNVTVNDTPGADGIKVETFSGLNGSGSAGDSVAGEYGTLTLEADGSYSYTRNAGTPGGVTDSFNYTIVDGDGDTANATLVVSIADSPTSLVLARAGDIVEEAGLAGPPAGSASAGNGEFASDTFTMAVPDGPAIVTINGTTISAVGDTITGSFGTLTITGISSGSISYSYELTTNTSGDHTSDDFAVVVTDQDGDHSNGTLVVSIVDDVPTALADTDSVTEDGPLLADGNVLTGSGGSDANVTDGVADVSGADGATVTAVAFGATAGTVGTGLAGAYGTLTLNTDGSYSYALDNANPLVQGLDKTEHLTETFTYTITDGDGDASSTTLTITVNGADDGVTIGGLNAEGPEQTVFENDLADGSSPDASALTRTGTFTVTAQDGVSTISVGGHVIYTGDAFVAGQTIATAYGTLTLTGVTPTTTDGNGDVTAATVSYSYTLNDNTLTHTGAADIQLTDTFAIVVTDTDGSTANDHLEVTVVDDVPTAHDDSASVNEGSSISGTVLTNDVAGADGFAASPTGAVTGIASVNQGTSDTTTTAGNYVLAGQYGTLTLNQDGSYSYQSNGNSVVGTQHDVFHYTVIDGDGDTSTANLDITINNVTLTADNQLKTVNEAALDTTTTGSDITHGTVTGSNPALTTETVTGALAVTGATTYTLVGSTTGAHGQIQLNSDGTYTYTLTSPVDNLPHANDGTDTTHPGETFTYTAADSHGNTTTGTITIDIVDDVPTARADTDTVAAGTFAPELGNVISGSGTTSGLVGADTAGADGARVSFGGTIVGGVLQPGSGQGIAPGGPSVLIHGQYGDLVLSENGDYSYTRHTDTPGGVDDKFLYVLVDGDGDASPTTLTITIDDSTPSLLTPTLQGFTTVDESGLPARPGESAGSNEPSNSEIVSGTATFHSADGIQSLTIAGVAIDPALFPQTVSSDATGTLVITGGAYDEVTGDGHLDYTYTLTDNTSGDATSVSFTGVLIDDDGDVGGSTLTIHIVDDVPTAHDDSASVNEGSSISGTVLTNDVAGADGFAASPTGAVTGIASVNQGTSDTTTTAGNYVLAGQYGTLTLNQDGSYSYQSNGNSVVGTQHDVFHYTVIDGDGDTSTANLDITINNVTLTADNQLKTVNEAALDTTTTGSDITHGTVTGSNPALTTETVTGALAVTGATTYTLVGSTTGAHGQIQLNSDGTYTYTLTSPVDNLPHANDGTDTTHPGETFTYTAADSHGNTTTGTITIDIVDDVPTAHDDSASVNEGSSISGTVLTNDVAGADGFAASPTGAVTGIASVNQGTSDTTTTAGNYVLAGQYGTLTLNQDGSYSYQSNGNSVVGTQHDVFHYTVIDGDGDTSTANLDITINNVTLTADNQLKTVNEAALDTTTTGSDITHGTVTGSNPALTTETVTGALAVTGATTYTLVGSTTGAHGQIQLNSDGTYTYTLTSPVDNLPHANDGTDTTHPGETFTYTAADSHGNTTTGTITIDIVDDVPTAHDDSASVNEGSSISGTVLTNDVAGADGFAASPTGAVTGIASVNQGTSDTTTTAGNYVLAGQYGTLTLNQDGSYSYQSNGNSVVGTQHDVFHYTVIDGDGDTSTANLDITINNVTLTADNQLKTVNEAALDTTTTGSDITHGTVTGSNPALTTETVTGALAVTGATTYTLVGSTTGAHGQIQLNSDGTYTYTLTSPVDNLPHANDGTDTTHPGETFTYTAADSHGNTTTGTITIDIVDDVPTAHDDSASVNEGSSISGTVLTNDVAGADGFAASPTGAVTGIASVNQGTSDTTTTAGNYVLAGQYGTLTLNQDGSYSYQSNGNSVVGTQHDVFHYTVIDGDGDTSTANLDITINNVTLTADNQLKTVNEAALDTTTTGSDITHGTVTGSNPALTTETVTGALAVTGATTYTLVGSTTGAHGQIQLNSDGTYTYTLTSPVDNLPHANDGTDTTHPGETFTYTAADSHGNTTTGTITIDIVDDVPTAHDDSASVNEGSSISGTVLTNDVAGADGFAASPTGAVTGIASVNQATSDTTVDGSGNYVLAGQYGTLTLNRDGSYSYQSNGNSVVGTQHDVFHYTVIDGDGDTSTANLDITINNVTLTADNQLKTVNEAALDTTTTGSDITHGTVTGSNPALTTETVTGALAVTGATTYTLVGSTTGAHGQIQLNSDGTYTYTLTSPVDNLPHANDGTDTTHPGETFTYTAADGHGNTTTGTITIDIVDDVPTAVAADSVSVNNVAAGSSFAYLDTDHLVGNNYGADGPGAVIFTAATITALQGQNLTSGLASLNYAITNGGTTLTATKSTDSSVVFTLELQPSGHTDQYHVTISQPLDSLQTVDFNDGSYNFVGGNGSWAGFTQPGDNNSQDLLLSPVGGGTVNTNANEGGVASGNSVGSGEAMRVDYVIDLNGSPVSGGNFNAGDNTQTFDGHYTVNGGSAFFTHLTSSTVHVAAFDDNDSGTLKNVGDGTLDTINKLAISFNAVTTVITANGTYAVGGHNFTVTFNGDGTANVAGVTESTKIAAFTATGYNSIEWGYAAGDTFKIGDFGATVITNDPVHFTAPISIQDSDGDIADSGSLSITANPVTPPIALDLNGDGIDFLGLGAGVTHDYGHGLVATAWVGADDGLLAHNTGNGLDVVFTDDAAGATSDLQGLALAYDSNHDGQLTSADAAWSTFGVWQDANSNGVADAGEFKTLDQAGISAISLTTDGTAYSAAGGDVTVVGTGSYTRADGSSASLADTVFATSSQKIGLQTTEFAAAAAALGGFLAVPLTQPDSASDTAQTQVANLATVLAPAVESITGDVEHTYTQVSAASLEFGSNDPQPQPEAPASSAAHDGDSSANSALPELVDPVASGQDQPAEEPHAAQGEPVQPLQAPQDIALMDALLTMAHNGPAAPAGQQVAVGGTEATQDMPNIAVALHDALAGQVVDQIVDKFTAPKDLALVAVNDVQQDAHQPGTDAAAAQAPVVALDTQLDAQMGGHGAFFAAMAAMPIVDEHAVVVAA